MSDKVSDDPKHRDGNKSPATDSTGASLDDDTVVEISTHKHFEGRGESPWLAPLVIVVSMVALIGIGVALVLTHGNP